MKAKSYWEHLKKTNLNQWIIVDFKKENEYKNYFNLGRKTTFNAIKRELGKLFCEYEEKKKNILLKDIIKDIDNILYLLEE